MCPPGSGSPPSPACSAIVVVDLVVIGRRPHEPSRCASATIWVLVYIGLAMPVRASGLAVRRAGSTAGEFFAGYVTEYSLSVDNLFVFMIIMARFAVPGWPSDKVLLHRHRRWRWSCGPSSSPPAPPRSTTFNWVFYIFGAFLVYTAVRSSPMPARTTRRTTRRTRSGGPGGVLPLDRLRRHPLFVTRHGRRRVHPAGARRRRDRRGQRRVRAGLDPRDLRADDQHLHRLRRQRLRADGPAPAVLPGRRAAGAHRLPQHRAGGDPRRSSAPSW